MSTPEETGESPQDRAIRKMREMRGEPAEPTPEEEYEETEVDPVTRSKLEVLELMKEQLKTDSSLAELGVILKKYSSIKAFVLQLVAALCYLGKGPITNFVQTMKLEPTNDDKVIYTSKFDFFDKNGKQVYPEEFTKILTSADSNTAEDTLNQKE